MQRPDHQHESVPRSCSVLRCSEGSKTCVILCERKVKMSSCFCSPMFPRHIEDLGQIKVVDVGEVCET